MTPEPNDTKQSHGGGDLQTSGSTHPKHPQHAHAQRDAATDVIRAGIDQLYDESGQVPGHGAEPENPYHRTHDANPTHVDAQWRDYHTAWQNYYQQYYEAYYHHHLTKAQAQAKAAADAKAAAQPLAPAAAEAPSDAKSHMQPQDYFSGQPKATEQPVEIVDEQDVISKDEALYELRQKLLSKVTESARRVRRSRHFMPITVALVVVLMFVFIQYNKVFIGTVAAYVAPGSLDIQDVVIDPNSNIQVSEDPRIIIPKINVDVPVAYDVGNDHDSQMTAMKGGLAHFAIPGASSHPGEVGNTVVAGHSSNDLFDTGDYKFIFAQLEKLVVGDTFYANYQGTRYTYVVTELKVVAPTDVNSLVYDTDKPIMTLLTCTPLGTSLNRLLVIGEQVSPDPAGAKTPSPSETTEQGTLSGANTPSLFERLFGAR